MLEELENAKKLFSADCLFSGGRPRKLYWTKRIKTDNGEHLLGISKMLLRWDRPCLFGDECDPVLRPDATLLDPLIHLEYDRNTETFSFVLRRLQQYTEPVLFVTITHTRASAVRGRCWENIEVCHESEADDALKKLLKKASVIERDPFDEPFPA